MCNFNENYQSFNESDEKPERKTILLDILTILNELSTDNLSYFLEILNYTSQVEDFSP